MYHLDQDAIEVLQGHIELDESYFGGARKGKLGLGAAGIVVVFSLFKRNGKTCRSTIKYHPRNDL